MARHRFHIRRGGEYLDLLGVGANLPPMRLEDADALTPLTLGDGEEHTDWSVEMVLRRYGRVVLTGLPGSGKSTPLRRWPRDRRAILAPRCCRS